MVFVRVKRISGKEYAYLVANSWTGSGPRQKVSKYLGRLIRPGKAKSEGLQAFLGLTTEQDLGRWIGKNGFKDIAAALIKLELSNHNISSESGGNSNKGGSNGDDDEDGEKGSGGFKISISVEKAEFLNDKSKPIVVAMNNGFLCSHTAKKLLEYDAAADYSGYNLADALTAAGIAVEKEVFITLFGKAQATTGKGRQDAAEKEMFKDFYY